MEEKYIMQLFDLHEILTWDIFTVRTVFSECVSNIGIATGAILDLNNNLIDSEAIRIATERLNEARDACGLSPQGRYQATHFDNWRNIQKSNLVHYCRILIDSGAFRN